MSNTISASLIAAVNPGVIGVSGTAVDLTGILLTSSSRVPIGTVATFATAAAVGAYFGPTSPEAYYANYYFGSYTGATKTPGSLGYSQYPTSAVPAYLRSGPGLTLAQVIAISPGTITISINGTPTTSGTITLSGAASLSNAASIIQTALAVNDASFTGAISTTTLTVSAVASGTLAVGQVVAGAGVTAGTTITAILTGTGGIGTYTVSVSQSVSSEAMTSGAATVTYDSVSGSFIITGGTPGPTSTIAYPTTGATATSLLLTQATGAVLSQGAAIATPAAAMAAIIAQTQNFATFSTVFEPVTADCVAFAAWNATQGNRYAYVCWDTDVTVTQPNPTTSAGYLIQQAGSGGCILTYEPAGTNVADGVTAACVMGYAASLDYARLNARTVLAGRNFSGLVPGVTDTTVATQLAANGYSFYGAYGSGANTFQLFENGAITGPFKWADSYLNQIKLNNDLQLAMISLIQGVGQIPFNPDGYGLVEAAGNAPIISALDFGTIRTNVTLSALQIAEVNMSAGRDIATTLSTVGWYILVTDPGSTIRVARGPLPVTVYYCDGQSVQTINLASLDVL